MKGGIFDLFMFLLQNLISCKFDFLRPRETIMKETGKIIMVGGVILVTIGFIIWIGGDKLKWFGNLLGDIRVKKPHVSFYMPIVSMIILSIFLSFVFWIIRKFF